MEIRAGKAQGNKSWGGLEEIELGRLRKIELGRLRGNKSWGGSGK